jgi:hypothetical protein
MVLLALDSPARFSGCRRRRFFTRFVIGGVRLAMSLRLGVARLVMSGLPNQSARSMPAADAANQRNRPDPRVIALRDPFSRLHASHVVPIGRLS